MALLKVYSNDHTKKESKFLNQYAANIKSQSGEDGIVAKMLEIIGVDNKWCVEFGAWDGEHLSNSWLWINRYHWSSVLVEGDKERFEKLQALYAKKDNVFSKNEFVSIEEGSESSLDAILATTPAPRNLDYLSIDIDGCDWHVWKSLVNYKPRVVVIEFNPSIPNNVFFVQDADMSANQGSSLRAMVELANEKGYELVATTHWNAFFVWREDFPKFNIADNSIDAMHMVGTYESVLFQLYDGTLIMGGCRQLIWKNIPISSEDIQVLPRSLRKYG